MLNLTGQQFGRLTALHVTDQRNYKNLPMWFCKCSCGNNALISSSNLNTGKTRSCGCLNMERIKTHGLSGSPEYTAWEGMIQRCTNIKTLNYNNYGGRGIMICDRWLHSFENFYTDMGPRLSPDHSIDRYPNNDGHYEPGNCRWATQTEQLNNRRNNHLIDYNGITYTSSQLAEKLNINPAVFNTRLNRNWSIEKIIDTPIRQYGIMQ
jgi:hypothetical protein